MSSQGTTEEPLTLSPEEREHLRQEIAEASELIAPFWPMKTFIAQNPIHGLEYLPFDQAVRKAKHLLGGNGYLANEEYRQFYCEGRITEEGVRRAFERVGPREETQSGIQVGGRQITARDVWRLHLLFGLEALEPALLTWEFTGVGATQRFRQDLPEESRRRIIQRTIEECELCRDYPEEAYLTNLWKSVLSALSLSDSTSHEYSSNLGSPQRTQPSQEVACSLQISLPAQRTVSDWVDTLTDSSIVEQVNNQLIKWIAAFVDEGLAGWEMPLRKNGFYHAWRDLAQHDRTGFLMGIKEFPRKIRDLPDEPEDAIVRSLHCLGIPEERWREYLSRQLSQLPGWTGLIRWLGENPAYHAQCRHPFDLMQYLAVRLFYEVELVHVECQRYWGIEGTLPNVVSYWQNRPDEYEQVNGRNAHAHDPNTQGMCRDAWRLFHLAQFLELSPMEMQDLSSDNLHTLLHWIESFPSDQHGPVWLEAYEDVFREKLIAGLSAHRGTVPETEERPRAQLVFCIDVRSESFRRHIEAQGPYETFGFAGFFGIPISHQAFDSTERSALCPVLLSPHHAVTEIPRSGEDQALQRYYSGTRWHQLGHHLFHDLKHNPVSSLMLIDVLGLFFSIGLIGKTLVQRPYQAMKARIQRWFTHPVPTRIAVSSPLDPFKLKMGEVENEGIPVGLAQGFSLTERATFIENGLRGMGLTSNFGRLVVLCGHGSQTDNNPYFGALDCGACGGNSGDPTARVFAVMANEPEVRQILKEKGLTIPDDTWFLPGKHTTTTDRVTFYDIEELPESHAEDVRMLSRDLDQAGARQALERCHHLPGAPTAISPERAFVHVEARSCDWANPRPEWGLAGNASFLIGRRKLTKGLDLGGRVFLHSYDPVADPAGAILEKIMTAPLIVGEWINMGYYFSGVDPWFYGGGSKVIHNVVSGIGVMLGSQSDLQTGFPLQTVNDGALHYHEPMRLLAIIEALPHVISPIIQRHAILQQLFHNQWVNLVALDPTTFKFHRYNSDATWEPVQMSQLANMPA